MFQVIFIFEDQVRKRGYFQHRATDKFQQFFEAKIQRNESISDFEDLLPSVGNFVIVYT